LNKKNTGIKKISHCINFVYNFYCFTSLSFVERPIKRGLFFFKKKANKFILSTELINAL